MCVDIIVLILSVLWYSRGPRQERPPYQVDPSGPRFCVRDCQPGECLPCCGGSAAPMAPIRLNPARGGWGMNPLEVAGDLGVSAARPSLCRSHKSHVSLLWSGRRASCFEQGRACHVAPGMVAHFLFWVMLTHCTRNYPPALARCLP